MRTFNKIFVLALAAAGIFASCSKEQHTYEPGKPAGKYDVYFAEDNANTVILPLTAQSFTVSVERADGAGAISVPVSLWCSAPGLLTVPETVAFQEGQTQADLLVAITGDMEPFTNYMLNIKLAEEYTQPYKETDVYPQYGVTFYKEDYTVVDNGVYYDDFFFGEEYPRDLEYSELLDQYRIVDPWMSGVGQFAFKWNGESSKVTMKTAASATGWTMGNYGLVTANFAGAEYDADDNAIWFDIKWTVSAGSFGNYWNVYYFGE